MDAFNRPIFIFARLNWSLRSEMPCICIVLILPYNKQNDPIIINQPFRVNVRQHERSLPLRLYRSLSS